MTRYSGSDERYPSYVTPHDVSTGKQMSYRQIAGPRGALATLTPFRHSGSLTGGWDEQGSTFYVFSYSTCIAWINVYGEHWHNPERYSVTTSKQQTYVRAWLGAAGTPEAAFGVTSREV